jgi:hypothetical protein
MNAGPQWENPGDALLARLTGIKKVNCTTCTHFVDDGYRNQWCLRRAGSPNSRPQDKPAIVGQPGDYLCVAYKFQDQQ